MIMIRLGPPHELDLVSFLFDGRRNPMTQSAAAIILELSRLVCPSDPRLYILVNAVCCRRRDRRPINCGSKASNGSVVDWWQDPLLCQADVYYRAYLGTPYCKDDFAPLSTT